MGSFYVSFSLFAVKTAKVDDVNTYVMAHVMWCSCHITLFTI